MPAKAHPVAEVKNASIARVCATRAFASSSRDRPVSDVKRFTMLWGSAKRQTCAISARDTAITNR